MFVIWSLIRALRCVTPYHPVLPTLVMSASASMILSTWMFARDECNPTYIKFLDTHGGQSRETMIVRVRSAPCGCAERAAGDRLWHRVRVWTAASRHGLRPALLSLLPPLHSALYQGPLSCRIALRALTLR